jgi:hypothetical protein
MYPQIGITSVVDQKQYRSFGLIDTQRHSTIKITGSVAEESN